MIGKDIMGVISSVALLIPLVIIFALRLQRFKCFLALAIYYLLIFGYNLIAERYISVTPDLKRFIGITINLLELPLMFTFMAYFSSSVKFAKRIRFSVLAFLAFELIISLIYGYNKNAMVIIMAPGLAMILFFAIWFSLRQIKITIMQGKATGKALMITSMLFAYGCYTLIYILYYIIQSTEVADLYTIYFIASTLSALILATGVVIENKRIKKLEELKITRKELNMVYGGSSVEKTVSVKMAIVDEKQWN